MEGDSDVWGEMVIDGSCGGGTQSCEIATTDEMVNTQRVEVWEFEHSWPAEKHTQKGQSY